MAKRLTMDAFFTGFLAALYMREEETFSMRDSCFENALEQVYESLETLAIEHDLELEFRIRPHHFHGDSLTVRGAITSAVRRELVSLENPEYQKIKLKISPIEAEIYLSEMPGGKKFYTTLADEFLTLYHRKTV